MARAAATVSAGDYFTDEKRLLRVERIDGSAVMCEDAADPTVIVEVSLDDLDAMRRVKAAVADGE